MKMNMINITNNIIHNSNRKQVASHGLTLLEMVIALSIMTIVFASVVPIFGRINDNWDSKQNAAETLQNGRILCDHLYRNLTKAVKITNVSNSTETDGFIEFENNDAQTFRYAIADTDNYVEYGQIGDLSDLAGPVSELKFSCYDPCDLDTPITDVNSIRFVKVETILTNASDTSQNKYFRIAAYLRSNVNGSSGSTAPVQVTYDYSNGIQGTNIFAYSGEDNVQVTAVSTTPENIFSSTEYDDIEYDDGNFHIYSTIENSKYAQMRFVFQIDEDKDEVTQITALFNGKGINSKKNDDDGISLYIWNYTSSVYELLEVSGNTEDEVTLSETLLESLTDYIGESGQDTVILLVATNGKKPNKESLELFADYVKLEITTGEGGTQSIYP